MKELTIDDPSPGPGWLPSPEQIARWSKQIREANERAAGIQPMTEHERMMMTDAGDDDESQVEGSKCH